MKFLQSGHEDTLYGFELLGALVVSQFLSSLINVHIGYYQIMIGCRSSNTLVAVIYRKLSRLSPSTNKDFESGQITNFI